MKIELKNIKHHAALSEETNAFSASLYIDGKKSGTAENTGKGGQTLVRAYGENRDIIRQAEDYCRNLPPRTTTLFNGEKMDLPMSLDFHIDTLVAVEFARGSERPFLADPKKVEYIDTNSDLLKSAITASLYWEVFRHSEGMADRVTPANPHQI